MAYDAGIRDEPTLYASEVYIQTEKDLATIRQRLDRYAQRWVRIPTYGVPTIGLIHELDQFEEKLREWGAATFDGNLAAEPPEEEHHE